VLERAAGEPDLNAMRLSLPAGSERARLIGTVSGADAQAAAPGLVHELIEAAADRAPDAPAVTGDAGSLSYAELDQAANRWAWYLRERGVGPDHLVAVCMQRSAHLIVALLGVLKAGGAYLPVDPDYPTMRTAFLLRDAQPALILTDSVVAASGALDLGAEPGPVIPVVLADDAVAVAGQPSSRPARLARPDNLAYAIYTSGSTGTPKGALLSHAAIASRCGQTQRDYPLGPPDGMLVRTPIGFDVFGSEWIWPLIAGARAVLARPGGEHDPEYLAGLIARERVSIGHFVPSTLQALLTAPGIAECAASLRWPTCGGEELPADLVARLGRLVPGATLRHEYGPTETAVNASVHPVAAATAPGGRTPIGRPVPGVRLYILDHNGDLVPHGVAGNLYIGGAQVARGYLGRPGLTAERFVPDPFCPGGRLYQTGDRARWLPSDDLDFIGRVDNQVKIRGHRIELGEVEAILAAYPGVDRAAVIVAGDGPGDRRLIGYLACAGGGPALEDLRAHLRARLPAALIPESFCVLDELPLSPHGKLDRAALPDPGTGQLRPARSRVPASTPVEQVLADIWVDVLGQAEVGVRDDFYDLGGNSLRAVTVFEQAQELGLLLPLQMMLGNHTIEQLAACTGDRQAESLHQLEGLVDS
jgi:amino acid adenylation domain-containing protein